MSQKLAGLLHALQRYRVGDQQHVGNRIAGIDLGHQLGHDLRRPVTHPFNFETRIGGLETINGRLRVLVRLAGIKHQIGGIGGCGDEAERYDGGESGEQRFHGSSPCCSVGPLKHDCITCM
ncbi:hypothetical protein D3C86_1129820 [compost metagenome]